MKYMFKMLIAEKTRIKIETLENHVFDHHRIDNEILSLETKQ